MHIVVSWTIPAAEPSLKWFVNLVCDAVQLQRVATMRVTYQHNPFLPGSDHPLSRFVSQTVGEPKGRRVCRRDYAERSASVPAVKPVKRGICRFGCISLSMKGRLQGPGHLNRGLAIVFRQPFEPGMPDLADIEARLPFEDGKQAETLNSPVANIAQELRPSACSVEWLRADIGHYVFVREHFGSRREIVQSRRSKPKAFAFDQCHNQTVPDIVDGLPVSILPPSVHARLTPRLTGAKAGLFRTVDRAANPTKRETSEPDRRCRQHQAW